MTERNSRARRLNYAELHSTGKRVYKDRAVSACLRDGASSSVDDDDSSRSDGVNSQTVNFPITVTTQTHTVISQIHDIVQTNVVVPQTDIVVSQTDSIVSQIDTALSQADIFTSQIDSVASQANFVASHIDTVAFQNDNVIPQTHCIVTPQSNVVTPQTHTAPLSEDNTVDDITFLIDQLTLRTDVINHNITSLTPHTSNNITNLEAQPVAPTTMADVDRSCYNHRGHRRLLR